jgi:uncharacterized protein (DUF1499 family)
MKLASRRNVLGAAILLVAVGALTMNASAPFGFWQALGRATGTRDDLGPVDFSALERRSSPNDALVCPPDACPRARADEKAPIFDMPAAQLGDTLRRAILAEPRVEALATPAPNRLRFAQRSFLMRYPDIIDILVLPIGEDRSTLALYSRSAVGHSDLGVNAARLRRWLSVIR